MTSTISYIIIIIGCVCLENVDIRDDLTLCGDTENVIIR